MQSNGCLEADFFRVHFVFHLILYILVVIMAFSYGHEKSSTLRKYNANMPFPVTSPM